MFEDLIRAEAKRCRAPLAGFLAECSRNVPLRHGGLRGVILQQAERLRTLAAIRPWTI
jgi:hypothetical protein